MYMYITVYDVHVLWLSRWMTVLYSRKQGTIKEKEKREEEKEKLVEGEEDSRSKSFSTLLYEDKVSLFLSSIPSFPGPFSFSVLHTEKHATYKSWEGLGTRL